MNIQYVRHGCSMHRFCHGDIFYHFRATWLTLGARLSKCCLCHMMQPRSKEVLEGTPKEHTQT